MGAQFSPGSGSLALANGLKPDGYVVPNDLCSLYQAGRFNDAPILAGNTSDEAASFSFGRANNSILFFS